ncbi:hypothetical protein CEP54_008878 [Fusarium duplospermum]|uniref:C2H2-type domain-containing protein n=1 Tax=Fusarium duplospermum TaxID=1325734 RepID=A0A428PTX8_9HYPO|nr:hypothetical protein CEP54_008878 [Fusarium duplospermum]
MRMPRNLAPTNLLRIAPVDEDAPMEGWEQAGESLCPRTLLGSGSAFASTDSNSGSTNHEAPSNPERVIELLPPSPLEPDTEITEDSLVQDLSAVLSQPMELSPKRSPWPYQTVRRKNQTRVRINTKQKFFPDLYSCPYRKRNPRMFNVCEFRKCAVDSFSTIAEVKQHILEDHLSSDFTRQCLLCNLWFRGKDALGEHLRARACLHLPPAVVDAYDKGINEATANKLRDSGSGAAVETWHRLWRTLFPEDERTEPANFVAPLHHEPNSNQSHETFIERSDQSVPPEGGRSSHSQQEISDCPTQPTVDEKTAMLAKNPTLQQVGLARVQIEILSLFKQNQQQRVDEYKSLGESTSGTDGEEFEDNDSCCDADESYDWPHIGPETNTTAMNDTNQVHTSASVNHQAIPLRRNYNRREDDDGDGDGWRQNKRPRIRLRNAKPPRGRFACPYQVHEPWRDCFKPSKRNPQGGCDSISRLKDHMTRKHMLSYRCQRCWKQFNARHKAQEHRQSNCVQTDLPRYELFMTLEQEIEVERCSGMTPEDAWWALFKFLIPGMDQEDISQLKDRYFPYYVQVDMSLTIPSLTLSNVSFENTPTQVPIQPSTIGDEPTQSSWVSPPDALAGMDGTSLVSQSFSVPIYSTGISQAPSISSWEGSGLESATLSALQQSYESDSTGPSDRINMSSTTSSLANQTPSTKADTSQIRRNYERLKMRATQTDAENVELRETMKTCREEVKTAGSMLEEVLAVENLEGEVYERLSRAAEILIGVTGRLR